MSKGGRKNLKRAMGEDVPTLQDGQSIMKVISLRGSNIIEVMDCKGDKSLALFPAKFNKSIWIKQGSFVIVDGSGMEKALELGHKVSCIVSYVLFYEQVRALQRSLEWPSVFQNDTNNKEVQPTADTRYMETQGSSHDNDNDGDDDDDDLPPLELNLNRMRPPHFHSESDTDSDEC